MLQKKHRIPHSDFLKRRNIYKRVSSTVFSVFLYKNADNRWIRFAVIVSKKISKKAVDRNHIRRIIYSLIREIINKNNIKEYKYDIIFSIKKEIIKLKYKDIKKEIKNILNNL